MHNGVNLKAYYEPVYSIMDGIVEVVGKNAVSGNWVKLLHDNGLRSSYSHLAELTVESGQVISSSQQIGVTGNSGRSTGPHLHFRIYR